MLTGINWSIGQTVDGMIHALLTVISGLFVLLLFRIILRKISIACAAIILLAVLMGGDANADDVLVSLIQTMAIVGTILYVLVRYGLVATTVGLYMSASLDQLGLIADFSIWYAPSFLLPVVAALALLGWGFHTALAGQPIFGTGKLLDE